MEGVSLPHPKAEQVIQILFILGGCVKGETIRAGMLHGFTAVHALIQDEKGVWGAGLIGAVGSDLMHHWGALGELFGGYPDLAFSTPSTNFLGKK